MSWREKCTPFLVEIADHAAAVLREEFGLSPEQADHAGYLIMRRLAEVVGGASVYIPTVDSIVRHERDEAILADFNGRNHAELARKYGVTTIHVYRLVKRLLAEERARRQERLPID